MSDTTIAYCKIFPSIGLARLGNSPTEFYFGPQAPGQPLHPRGGFKDPQGRVKRQAARFRVYAYNAQDQVIKELTLQDAEINWTVHLANKKASFYEFKGRYRPVTPLRNATVQSDLPPDQRNLLIIDPGARSISGANQQGANYQFDNGGIGPLPVSEAANGSEKSRVTVSARLNVPLGELRTDDAGRLLVLASCGESGSLIANNPITDYANNDYWYDDTSDGPVTATVTLHNGQAVTVKGRAWVMCVPPHFTTDTTCLTTLYDQMEEAAGLDARPQLSFSRDLWPIFSRVASYSWVNKMALIGHGPGKYANFLDPNTAAKLADNRPENLSFRELIFQRIRNPNLIPNERIWDNNSGEQYPPAAANQADGYYMPPMAGDYGWDGPVDRDATTWLAVTPAQYRWLEHWRDGNFDNDWPALGQLGLPQPLPFEQIPVADQPQALTRAMLERTVGAPFYPGIEMTYIVRDKSLYSEPFRFADNLQAGDITRWMALPWQADFFECNTFWWPSARPDDVIPSNTYLAVARDHQNRPGYLLTTAILESLQKCLPADVYQKLTALLDVPFSTQQDFSWTLTNLLGKASYSQYGLSILQAAQQYDLALALGSLDQRRQWARGLGGPDDSPHGDNEMVQHWYQLGFIVPVVAPNGQVVYVETERSETLPQTPPRLKIT
jgi:hypothetical protein